MRIKTVQEKSKNASYESSRMTRAKQHARAGKACDGAGLFPLKRKDGGT
ncbi:hypothetical protein [Bartonella tribocorum]|nr:hypothetical protein [Bartonella tribocorum]